MATQLPLPPGTMGLPVIGETIGFLRDPQFARKRQAQYGSLFKTKILGRPTAFFAGQRRMSFYSLVMRIAFLGVGDGLARLKNCWASRCFCRKGRSIGGIDGC